MNWPGAASRYQRVKLFYGKAVLVVRPTEIDQPPHQSFYPALGKLTNGFRHERRHSVAVNRGYRQTFEHGVPLANQAFSLAPIRRTTATQQHPCGFFRLCLERP